MAHLNVSVSSDDDVEEVGNKSDRMDTESERDDLRDELDKSDQPGPEEGESEEEYSDEQGEDSLSERVNLNEEVAIELTDQEESPSEAEDDGLVTPKRKVKDPAPIWMCAIKVNSGAKCNFCQKIIKSCSGNTSSITRHVQRKHSNRQEVKEMDRILALSNRSKKIKRGDKLKKARIQSSILHFQTGEVSLTTFKRRRLTKPSLK